eukprot:TRINITY_DN8147_c0_g1_i1.p1 TRINITY_DN8147_c0_g1~~TRINITY_DN8147_c0_g1_i1.p1  ORF type:complete len:756 (+),score=138.43 TRINITY_DN8147_c0_g1_i1:2-2269(+)
MFVPTKTNPSSILNERLAFLEDLGLDAVTEALLDPQFTLLYDVVKILGNEALADNQLVKLVADFFRAHNREEELLFWSISNEIDFNYDAAGLFRMQSFATQMLFRLFFDDSSGMQYMRRTVLPVIQTLLPMKASQLELVPNRITVSVEEAYRNLMFILDVVGDLFKLLNREVMYCPTSIRRGFAHMKRIAEKKFPDVKDYVVPICFFLRFLCPTLLQSQEYGLMADKPPSDTFQALMIISKILQNIANGVIRNNITKYEPHNAIIITFLNTHFQSMQSFSATLTDEIQIKQDAKHFPAEKKAGKREREIARDELHAFLFSGAFRQYLDKIEEAEMKKEEQTKEFLDRVHKFSERINQQIESNDWKNKDTVKESVGTSSSVNSSLSSSFSGNLQVELKLSSAKKPPFMYQCEGKVAKGRDHIREATEYLDESNWKEILGEKIFDQCQCVNTTANPQGRMAEWILHVKTPGTFSFGKKKWEKCYNEICFYSDPSHQKLSFMMIPMPCPAGQEAKSKVRLEMQTQILLEDNNATVKMFFHLSGCAFVASFESVLSKEVSSILGRLILFLDSYVVKKEAPKKSKLKVPHVPHGNLSSSDKACTANFSSSDAAIVSSDSSVQLSRVKISESDNKPEIPLSPNRARWSLDPETRFALTSSTDAMRPISSLSTDHSEVGVPTPVKRRNSTKQHSRLKSSRSRRGSRASSKKLNPSISSNSMHAVTGGCASESSETSASVTAVRVRAQRLLQVSQQVRVVQVH